jgi:hypothetical protein
MGLIPGTHFVIAAEREAARGATGQANIFLAQRSGELFCITFNVAGTLSTPEPERASRRGVKEMGLPMPGHEAISAGNSRELGQQSGGIWAVIPFRPKTQSS